MKILSKAPTSTYLVLFVLSSLPWECYAYVDPGTGTIILQMILGGVGGLIVFLKLYWQNFKALFTRKRPEVQTHEKQELEPQKRPVNE